MPMNKILVNVVSKEYDSYKVLFEFLQNQDESLYARYLSCMVYDSTSAAFVLERLLTPFKIYSEVFNQNSVMRVSQDAMVLTKTIMDEYTGIVFPVNSPCVAVANDRVVAVIGVPAIALLLQQIFQACFKGGKLESFVLERINSFFKFLYRVLNCTALEKNMDPSVIYKLDKFLEDMKAPLMESYSYVKQNLCFTILDRKRVAVSYLLYQVCSPSFPKLPRTSLQMCPQP